MEPSDTQRNFVNFQEDICRPEGTVTFDYHSPYLFDQEKPGGIILEIPSGKHLFRLERDNDLLVHLYHSSPGTGTRVATIDLKELLPSPDVYIGFSWSPDELNLYIGPRAKGAELAAAKGVASQKQFRVGNDGCVYQVGDDGVGVMSITMFRGGEPILLPTAKEAWDETIRALEVLSTGQSTEGYFFEVIVTNLSLSMLVTGFEAYTKKRFLELEQEGITAKAIDVVNGFSSKKEKEICISDILESEATNSGISLLRYVVDRRTINFQNYNNCKRAYNIAYGIRFGDLSLSGQTLKNLQSFIRYRHRIIHVSPSIGILNQESMAMEEPVFPKKETAEAAKECFVEFIESLHQATLSLRSKPIPEVEEGRGG